MTALVDPQEFIEGFRELVTGAGRMAAACSPKDGDRKGGTSFCFELIARQERPSEFLQCMLDMLRITFEPNPPGTTFLNSNWDLITEAVPDRPFNLGYLSVVGGPGQSVEEVVKAEWARRLGELHYRLSDAYACFICVSAGIDRFRKLLSLQSEADRVFNAGFTVENFVQRSRAVANDCPPHKPPRQSFAGTALDESLDPTRIRLSAWLFLLPKRARVTASPKTTAGLIS